MGSAYRALVGKPEGRNHLEDTGVDGKIMLKWIFERLDGGALTGPMRLRWRAIVNAVMNLRVS